MPTSPARERAMRPYRSLPLGAAREREHGQILVLFAFILVGLLMISALAVDYGGWLLARRTYQNVADSAAIAGANLLTSPIGTQCSASEPSKNVCAREAAWQVVKDQLHLTGLNPIAEAFVPGTTPYADAGYRIWVASPPSDAGAKYPGGASSKKTIFVWVERDLTANLSRIVRQGDTVSSWATAGRIPENFAIVALCGPPDCKTPNGEDIKVNGTGSTLVLENGDLGSNSYVKTAGSSAAVALSQDSSAYMHYPGQCTIGDPSCLLVTWVPPRNDSLPRSALALPQVVDPNYAAPPISATTVPWQCAGSGAIASLPGEGPGPLTADAPSMKLVSYMQPQATPGAMLSAPTSTGKVTDVSFGGNLSGALVTVTTTANVFVASATTGATGSYSIGLPSAGTYNVTVTKANYITQTKTITAPANGNVMQDFAMLANPGTLTGTVRDATTLAPIVGATVAVAGGGATTTNATGQYTITAVAAGSRSVTASMASYTPQTLTVVMPAGGPATLNFNLGLSGTITGTVTESIFNQALIGATVSIAGVQTTLTVGPGGTYTLAGIPSGTYTITAAMTGYNTGSRSVTVTAGSTLSGINFTLVPTGGTLAGNVVDDITSQPIAGAGILVNPGGYTTTTNGSGHYVIAVPASSGPGYDITASKVGYIDSTANNVRVNGGVLTTQNFRLWPSTCEQASGGRPAPGSWLETCGAGQTNTCPTVTNPTGANVSCSYFDVRNRIKAGTYQDITIGNNKCAYIDPISGWDGSQTPGIVHITGHLDIGSNAFLFGDGVTIVMDPGSFVTVGNSGGFVLNYMDSSGNWRTGNRTACDGTTANLSKTAWTTKARATWDTSVNPPCFVSDGPNPAEIGIAWYLRGDDTTGTGRFDLSGLMGFQFDGVLYAPRDDIGLGGQAGQAAAGQIVAYTITYSGGTTIFQRYAGIEIDGPPYLIEPYLGQ